MTTTPVTPATVTRRKEAEQMGDFADREYRNLVDDHTWDRDTWQELIAQIQENPYEDDQPGVTETERASLYHAWSTAFATGEKAQRAENNRTKETK